MRERGLEVAVAGETSASLPPSKLPAADIPTAEIRGRNLLATRRAVRDTRPDVVHAHWLPGAAFMAALVRARPLISMAWGSDVYAADRRRLLQCRYALRRSDVAMADSRALLDRLIELGADPESRLPDALGRRPGAVLAGPGPGGGEARLGLPDAPVILSARGLDPVYNPDVVLTAFERLRERRPERAAPAEAPGARRAGARRPPRSARRPGPRERPYERLADYFRAADACVSIPRTDSSPRSVWEAMACGCPACSRTCPGRAS